MSSLVLVSRRLGKLALTRRAAPMAWKALSTRTQKKKTEEHTFHHRDFYGDENPQMRDLEASFALRRLEELQGEAIELEERD